MRITLARTGWLAFFCALLTFNALAERTTVSWASKQVNAQQRLLTYSASATLLGTATPIQLEFICDTTASKQVNGVLGFDLKIRNAGQLKAFRFEDFEGPDAPAHAKKLMQISLTRKNQPALSFNVVPNGSSDEGSFVFNFSGLSKQPNSLAKTLLKALAEDGAETLRVAITDFRDAKVKLDVSVPVADRQAAFKELLTGLK